jgi:hypothetical protein
MACRGLCCRGLPWFAKASRPVASRGLCCHGLPWLTMVCRGLPCFAVVCVAVACHALPWLAVLCCGLCCRGLPCFAVVCVAVACHALLWFVLPWPAVLCRGVPCFAVLNSLYWLYRNHSNSFCNADRLYSCGEILLLVLMRHRRVARLQGQLLFLPTVIDAAPQIDTTIGARLLLLLVLPFSTGTIASCCKTFAHDPRQSGLVALHFKLARPRMKMMQLTWTCTRPCLHVLINSCTCHFHDCSDCSWLQEKGLVLQDKANDAHELLLLIMSLRG